MVLPRDSDCLFIRRRTQQKFRGSYLVLNLSKLTQGKKIRQRDLLPNLMNYLWVIPKG